MTAFYWMQKTPKGVVSTSRVNGIATATVTAADRQQLRRAGSAFNH